MDADLIFGALNIYHLTSGDKDTLIEFQVVSVLKMKSFKPLFAVHAKLALPREDRVFFFV